MIISLLSKLFKLSAFIHKQLSQFFFSDLLLLISRAFISLIFLKSGYLKIENLWNGEGWECTIFLFKEVHPVPFLSPEIGAILGTSTELLFGSMVFLGLGFTLGTLGLIGITATIQISGPNNPQHFLWFIIMIGLLASGPGKLSLDEIIFNWWRRKILKEFKTTNSS